MSGKLSKDQKYKIICELYNSGISSPKIAENFHISPQAIRGVLQRRGIKRRTQDICQRKYNCDHDFFDKIDSEEKAYWLGFIMADGCIYRNSLTIGLSSKDRSHLEKFKTSIKSSHPIKERINNGKYLVSIFFFRSKKMVDSLQRHNVIPNKTLREKWPILRKNLIHHFIRGYFDGDGSFSTNKKVRSHMVFSIVSGKEFLNKLANELSKSCGLNIAKLFFHPPVYYLRYGGRNQISRIFHFLYDGASIFLERKRLKIINAISY